MKLILTFTLLFLSSCFFSEDGKIEINPLNSSFGTSNAQVSSVSIVNDQLVVNGSGLSGITKVQITGPSSFDHTFSIESKSDSNLIANGVSNIAFALDAIFSLTVTDANGSATYNVTFTLQDDAVTTSKILDGAVTAAKLSDMGASTGQVLKYNGTTWVPGDLNALTYAGTWDASTATAPNVAPAAGEYYIVSVAAAGIDISDGSGSRNFVLGDWLVYNGSTTRWDKIDNASYVTSFNGRTGAVTPTTNDYTWAQIDKSASVLSQINDVEAPAGDGSDTGKVLKWNNATSTWELGDDLSGGGAGTVNSSTVADNSLTNDDINSSAAIAYSKLNIADGDLTIAKTSGLQTILDAKLPLAGGTMTGDLTMGANNIITSGNVDGVDVSTLATSVSTNTSTIAGLDTDDITEATNQYFTNARAIAAPITGFTSGAGTVAATDTVLQAIQKLDGNIAANTSSISSSGDILDGGNTEGAAVTIGTNDAQSLNLETNNSTALSIDSSGNVGVGTASPGELLDVRGNISIPNTSVIKVGGSGDTLIGHIGAVAGVLQLKGDSTRDVKLGSNSYPDSLFVEGTNGSIGIGVTTPTSRMEIQGNFSTALAGTVTVGAGTAAVTGSGTAFTTELAVGDAIKIGTETFTVQAIASNTALTLDSNHVAGASGVAATSDPNLMSVKTGDAQEVFTINSEGSVGVGATSPGALLDVGTGANARGGNTDLLIGGATPQIELYDTSDSGAIVYEDTKMSFYTNGGTSFTNVMSLTNTGNVGVGTTTPSTKLQVSGTVTATAFVGDGSSLTGISATDVSAGAGTVSAPSVSFSTDTNTGFYSSGADQIGVSTNGTNTFNFTTTGLTSPTTGGSHITTGNGTAAAPTFSFAGDTDTGWYRAAADTLAAATGGSERVRIDGSGNVGIGTTSPSKKLQVIGDSAIQDGTLSLILGADNGASTLTDATIKSGRLLAPHYTNAEEPAMMIFSNNTTSNNRISLGGGSSLANAATEISFYTAATNTTLTGTERMTINSSGNVGIGTTSPSYLLSVESSSSSGLLSRIYNSATNGQGLLIRAGETGSSDRVFQAASRDDTKIMTITSDGRVGIGTTIPGTRLELEDGGITGGTGILKVTQDDENVEGIIIGNDTANTTNTYGLKLRVQNDGTGIIQSQAVSAENLSFNPNGGNVGIGTVSPTSNLELQGNLSNSLTGTVTVGAGTAAVTGSGTAFTTELAVGDAIKIGTETFTVQAIASATALTLDSNHVAGATGVAATSDPNLVSIKTGDAQEVFTVNSEGKVGIGTSSPIAKLTIDQSGGGGTPNIRIRDGDNTRYRSDITMEASGGGLLVNAYDDTGLSYLPIKIDASTTVLGMQGSVGVGTASPSTKLEVNGTVTATAFAGDGSSLTGISASGVAAGAGTVGAPSMSFSTDTNTGFYSSGADQIGVSTNGTNTFNFTATGLTSPTTGGSHITTGSGTAAAPTFSFAGDTDTGWYRAAADTLAASTAGSERVRIDSSGNVGIGTTSPSYLFDVNGTAGIANGLYFNSVDSFLFNNANSSLRFGTNAQERVRIDSSGNVGIGTTSPKGKLGVSGQVSSEATNSHFEIIESDASADNGSWLIDANAEQFRILTQNDAVDTWSDVMLVDRTGTTVDSVLFPNGNVGIGTSTPNQQKLHVASSTSDVGLRFDRTSSGNHDWDLQAISGGHFTISGGGDQAPSEYFRITNTGNVGIGTTGPGAKLDVAGDIRFDTNLFVDNAGAHYFKHNGGTASTDKFIFRFSDNEDVLTVSGDGNVGIGTTSPGTKLHAYSNDDSPIRAESSDGFSSFEAKDPSGSAYLIAVSGKTQVGSTFLHSPNNLTVESSGNVGIGTTAPQTALDISTSGATIDYTVSDVTAHLNVYDSRTHAIDNGPVIAFSGNYSSTTSKGTWATIKGGDENGNGSLANGYLAFSTAINNGTNTERMRIDSSGNVGIGTTSPSEKLEVNGILKATSNATNFAAGQAGTVVDFWEASNLGRIGTVTGSEATSDLAILAGNNEGMRILSTGNVGIGTTSPSEKLDVSGNIKLGDASDIRGHNILQNYMSLGETESGASTILGNNAKVTNGSNNTVETSSSAADGSNWMKINYSTGFTFHRTGASSIGTTHIDTTGELMRITTSGNVGIGTTAPDEKLVVVGSTTGKYTSSGWTHSSDRRLKKDIELLDYTLDKILQLEPVSYVFKADEEEVTQVGFIAQDVEPIFPEVVKTDDKGFKSMVYANLVSPLIRAFQDFYNLFTTSQEEQDRIIASLKEENAEIKVENQEIRSENEEIKAKNKKIEKQLNDLKSVVCSMNPNAKICQ